MSNKENDVLTRTWVIALLAMICCILWGSAATVIKIGYQMLQIQSSDWASQMVFAGIRFFIAGLMSLAAGCVTEKKLLLPSAADVPRIGIISLFQTILQYFFYYIGVAHTTGVKAAILVAANVFFSILFSVFLFRQERFSPKKILGCIVGFSGIVIINSAGLREGLSLNFLGDGFVLLCTIASGLSSCLMKRYSRYTNPVLLSGWQFVFGGIVMWIFGAACGGHIAEITLPTAVNLLYLAFISAAAYTLWAVLLHHNPVSKVAVFGFMNPMCGVIISSIVLRESGAFGWVGLLSLILVCVGIWIVNYCSTN